jgi:hypothetical protein
MRFIIPVMIAITKIDPIRIKTIVVDRLLFFVLWYIVLFLETMLKRLMIKYFIE